MSKNINLPLIILNNEDNEIQKININSNYNKRKKRSTNGYNTKIKMKKINPDYDQISGENSRNNFLSKKSSENTNINSNQKKTYSQDNKSNEFSGNNEINYFNQEISIVPNKKDSDNHSRSVFISNKKGKIDEINGTYMVKPTHKKKIYD